MTKISKITTQKKNKSRYNIFIKNGEQESYAFSVDEEILIKFSLKKGMEIDDATKDLLLQKDSIHKVYTLALNYLSYRMRSKQEIATYLEKKEVDPEQIPIVIDRLVKEGFLDDKEFAIALVRTRLHTTSKGPLLIKKELQEKGITANVIQEALQDFTFEHQLEKALKWVEKKLKSGSKKSFNQQVQATQQTLMQKGFTNDVITSALANVNEEKDTETELQAVFYQGEKLVRKYEKKSNGFELKQKVKAALYRKGFNFDHIQQFIDENIEG